jgi:hypothetical protein
LRALHEPLFFTCGQRLKTSRAVTFLEILIPFVSDAQMSPALLGAAKALDQVDKAGR